MHGVKRMSALTATSKAFRATLQLSNHEVPILQRWAAMSCALHACFRSGRGTTVLVALRATPQTSASFARTIRNALRRCGVSTSGLRGRWLCCISEREAIAICLGTAELAPPEAPQRADEQRRNRGSVQRMCHLGSWPVNLTRKWGSQHCASGCMQTSSICEQIRT